MTNKKTYIGITLVAVVLIGFYFLNSGGFGNGSMVESQIAGEWINMELKDVATGETFTIKELSDSGKPVLLESFAVWCPTCTRQQKETKKFHEEFGDSVISISIDTDPNEDESRVREHVERNGFTWFYAISPVELTRSLIDQFGVGIVNAPSVPMILVCPENGRVRMLDSGIKSVNELTEEVSRGC